MMSALVYGEEHELLREQTRRYLSERCPIALVQAIAQGEAAPDFGNDLAELGWFGLVLPEEYGGAGLGFSHLAVVLEEAGRVLLPAPLLSTTLAALAISRGGSAAQHRELLPGLAAGERRATLAYVEPDGAWDVHATRARREDGRLHGEKHHVWEALGADLLVVPFLEAGRGRVAVVDASAEGVDVAPEVVLDATRPSARVRFSGVDVPEERVLEADGAAIFEALLPRACTALAAEQVGSADALLTMTAEYTATREQFGKPIGAFQAVKHPLVNVLIAVEQGRSLVYGAASLLDSVDPPAPDGEVEQLARMAKAHASDAHVFAASRAIQLHGGYGFTLDCPAHLYFKRAQASRAAWGDAAHHRRVIGDRLCA
jgi:alkylation response protein AidB-like acyl-CoA dehydrogenase